MTALYPLLALIPIVIAAVLLLALKWPASRAMPAAFAATVLLAIFAWKMDLQHLAGDSILGVFKAVELFTILFSALLIINQMRASGAMASINRAFGQVTHDPRIQAIIVGLGLGAFIEGAAGFGMPAALGAPLLVGLGFPPLAAVIVLLMMNVPSIVYGAVGTPTLMAVTTSQDIALRTGVDAAAYRAAISGWSAYFYILPILVLPTIGIIVLTRTYGKEKSWRAFTEVLPFLGFALTCYLVPFLLTATFIGPELPSLMGALFSLPAMMIAARKGFLVPKRQWEFLPREQWPDQWRSLHDQSDTGFTYMQQWRAWMPYVIVILFLAVTRIPALGISDFLQGWKITVPNLAGVQGLDYTVAPGYMPGLLPIFVVALLTPLLHRMEAWQVGQAWRNTFKMSIGTLIMLLASFAMVQVMLGSNINASGLDSMTSVIARALAEISGMAYPVMAPMIGMLGAFVSNSGTVSNTLFSALQSETAVMLHMPQTLIVSLQNVGAIIGVPFGVRTIIAALITVGMVGREGALMRKYYPIMIGMGLLLGLIGYLLIAAGFDPLPAA